MAYRGLRDLASLLRERSELNDANYCDLLATNAARGILTQSLLVGRAVSVRFAGGLRSLPQPVAKAIALAEVLGERRRASVTVRLLRAELGVVQVPDGRGHITDVV